MFRDLLVQTRILWSCPTTRSWISCWRRDVPSPCSTSLFLWTDSSSRTSISSTPQVLITHLLSHALEPTTSYHVIIGRGCRCPIWTFRRYCPIISFPILISTNTCNRLGKGRGYFSLCAIIHFRFHFKTIFSPSQMSCSKPVLFLCYFSYTWFFVLFCCSIRASTLFHNHAPEPLPAVCRSVHLPGCIGVRQGNSAHVDLRKTRLKLLDKTYLITNNEGSTVVCSGPCCQRMLLSNTQLFFSWRKRWSKETPDPTCIVWRSCFITILLLGRCLCLNLVTEWVSLHYRFTFQRFLYCICLCLKPIFVHWEQH